MKRSSILKTVGLVAVVAIAAILVTTCSNQSDNETTKGADSTPTTADAPKPLNLSIYLDLSDRLIAKDASGNPLTPSQSDRDIMVVGHLIDKFVDQAVAAKIVPCKNNIKVFFYPTPSDTAIVSLSSKLEVDLGKTPIAEKKKLLNDMKKSFTESLEQIYSTTCAQQNWLGCDIWGFFKDRAKNYCIREGYRNVLVVLTDGYIYYIPSHRFDATTKTGNYVTATLLNKQQNITLEVPPIDLSDLEVLMLEVNPVAPRQSDTLKSILRTWLQGMGVSKFEVEETDLPSNTKTIIDNFLK